MYSELVNAIFARLLLTRCPSNVIIAPATTVMLDYFCNRISPTALLNKTKTPTIPWVSTVLYNAWKTIVRCPVCDEDTDGGARLGCGRIPEGHRIKYAFRTDRRLHLRLFYILCKLFTSFFFFLLFYHNFRRRRENAGNIMVKFTNAGRVFSSIHYPNRRTVLLCFIIIRT